MRATLYVRLSKEATASNLSLEGMEADLRQLCARLGLEPVALHVDDGLSGSIRNRPAFLAWLADARDGRADALVAWHGDRITREGVNAAAMVLDVIEGKDPATGRVVRPPVRFVSYDDGLDSERDAEAFRWRFVIAAEVARAERARMVERNRAKWERIKEAGRYGGGSVPFGARVVSRDGGRFLELEPAEAELLRHAAALLLGGESLGNVARWLSARSRPRRVETWSRGGLRQTMLCAFAQSTIFSPDVAAALREALGEPAARRPEDNPGGGWQQGSRELSGLIFCGSCGSRMRVTRRGNGTIVYRCHARSHGRTCPSSTSIAARAAEARAAELVFEAGADVPIVERRPVIDEGNEAERRAAEDRKAAALAVLTARPDADSLAAFQLATAELDALPERSTSVRWEDVDTGRTVADAWPTVPELERHAMLEGAGIRFVVLPVGKTGRWSPERLHAFVLPEPGDPSPETVVELVALAERVGRLEVKAL